MHSNNNKSRYTPTCVGTILKDIIEEIDETVHPHVCGDNIIKASIKRVISGTPPRVWGQLSIVVSKLRHCRYTPTCVGTIVVFWCYTVRFPVHPHVCGDNYPIEILISGVNGTPPRVWGQCLVYDKASIIIRYTPTCVGTIAHLFKPASKAPVHPHVCGDNTIVCLGFSFLSGTPPRVWGQ